MIDFLSQRWDRVANTSLHLAVLTHKVSWASPDLVGTALLPPVEGWYCSVPQRHPQALPIPWPKRSGLALPIWFLAVTENAAGDAYSSALCICSCGTDSQDRYLLVSKVGFTFSGMKHVIAFLKSSNRLHFGQ